jgi:hypothetical protein
MKPPSVVVVAGFVACCALTGCSTVSANTIPTGPERLPARTGPVAIYALEPPADAKELGLVEVAANGEEGNVEALLPVFVQRVAQLGGNAAYVEGVQARFDLVQRSTYDTYWYPCGYRGPCASTRSWPTVDEVVTIRMFGRAFFVDGLGSSKPLGKPVPGPTGGAQ